MSFRKVLIATDGSAIAARALEVGADLASDLHALVAIVHAIDPDLLGRGVDIAPPEFEMTAQQEGAALLADARAMLPPGLSLQQFIVQGSAGEEIVKTANEWGADLIVIGSHGRSGIARTFLGSVAEAVMRHAPAPFLSFAAQRRGSMGRSDRKP